MSRYHVATAGECEAVRQAINAGWRAGPAAYAEWFKSDGSVWRIPIAEYEAMFAPFVPGRTVGSMGPLPPERLIVSGADAVLELPEDGIQGALISEQLGIGIVPAANQLAVVTRARGHSQFATGIRDILDDRYVDKEWDKIGNERANEAAARGQITAELQGQRAVGALARKDARIASQSGMQAIEKALGGGGGGGSVRMAAQRL